MRGAVLVETLIGITLGLLVVAAAVGAVSATLAAAAAGRDAADLQQRADLALLLIGNRVRQASVVRLKPFGDGLRFDSEFGGWQGDGSAIGGSDGGSKDGVEKPDTLQLSAPPGDAERDCLGNNPDSDNHLDAAFSIRPETGNGNRKALYCDPQGADGKPQAMVAGVDDLQVLYGILGPTGGLRYVNAGALTPATPVLSVSVCLQLSGDLPQGATGARDCRGNAIPPETSAGRRVLLARGVFKVRSGA